jgi:excisionase family DNA binding protein
MDSNRRQALTVPEAAEILGISRGLAYELVSRGDIPALRLGRRLVVPRKAIEAMLGEATEGSSIAPIRTDRATTHGSIPISSRLVQTTAKDAGG